MKNWFKQPDLLKVSLATEKHKKHKDTEVRQLYCDYWRSPGLSVKWMNYTAEADSTRLNNKHSAVRGPQL